MAGGAESLCRSTARALAAAGDDVHVYTTTARDYLTWQPHYAAGTTVDDGVTVHRFAARHPDPARSAELLRALSLGRGGDRAEHEWARAQGPVAPGMLRALAGAHRHHEAVALWTYLYGTTQLAMPLVAERSVLVPLAHDEPMFRFALTRGVVKMAAGLAFLTPEERRLVDQMHGIGRRPQAIVGAGLDPAPTMADGAAPADLRRRLPALPRRFVLYLGRVDPAKGIDALVRAHEAYRRHGGAYGLVLAGRPTGAMHLPDWVATTGFVDDATRAQLLDAAEVVVLPSPHESLSLVALEAWRAGRPTLANGRSDVLAGQSARSGGGFLYLDALDYRRQLARLSSDGELRAMLGRRGATWVGDGQGWDACVRRWRGLLAQVRRPLSRAD